MMKFERQCKECHKTIEYKSKKALNLAIKKDCPCSICSRKINNIHQQKFNLDFLLSHNNESGYFLGLIIADGYLKSGNFEITLQKKDGEVLLPKLSELCGGASIKDKKVEDVTFDRIMFRNKVSTDKVIKKFGFKERKTYNPLDFTYFANYDRSYLLSILIGIIDGDGYIYVSPDKKQKNISITFHKSWENFYLQFLEKLDIKHGKPLVKEDSRTIRISRVKHLQELFNFAEKELLTKLNRKWQKLQ